MENLKEIRWKQRFENFQKSFFLLERTIKIENMSEAERGGLIQFYEVAFELSWKILKDYLEFENFKVKSPRTAIKTAIQIEILDNEYDWIDALEDRNLTAHTYDEETILEISDKIILKYFDMIKELYNFFLKKI